MLFRWRSKHFIDVTTGVDLDSVGNWLCGPFQEVNQAIDIIHQLHQEHRQMYVSVSNHAQVLEDFRVSYGIH